MMALSKVNRTKLPGLLSLGSAGILVLAMMAATLLEKVYGTGFVLRHVYGSFFFILLWAVLAVSSLAWLLHRKVQRRPAVFLMHLSLLLILLGAGITHYMGVRGTIHLRMGEEAAGFASADGTWTDLPFRLTLKEFSVRYYPGTSAPMDYVSRIGIDGAGMEQMEDEVSMNNICSCRHYRFYQSSYDSDGRGTILSVAYDPLGIAVTYGGYGLLLLSALLFFLGSGSRFRQLLGHPLLRSGIACLVLGSLACGEAFASPQVLSPGTAEAFGNLYVYYNHRICPLQTLAREFTVKLCGKDSYRGYTAEQVFTGWFFYYDSWKEEPCMLVKGDEARRLLGIEGRYARLTDFMGADGYKLNAGRQDPGNLRQRRDMEELNEKFSLVSMVATGSMWKIYPYAVRDTLAGSGRLEWYALSDRLPAGMPDELWSFVRGSMNYVAEQVAGGNDGKVKELLEKIRKYQEREGGELLPSVWRFRAERWYNRLGCTRRLAFFSLLMGILALLSCCVRIRMPFALPVGRRRLFEIALGGLSCYLCGMMVLRGVAAGHWPMTNGYETMQLLALCAAVAALPVGRRVPLMIGLGFLLCGLALMVSVMGESNPRITPLVPVLSSPLLCFHVVMVMLAYALLALLMLNGAAALLFHAFRREGNMVERLHIIGNVLLYPAVFLLAAGIFVGAVWANVSWGRYWGWDPKEVWALITLLVYAAALHPVSLPRFGRPLFFHAYSVVAFVCVLVTYFGVNLLLGGMHSYANS